MLITDNTPNFLNEDNSITEEHTNTIQEERPKFKHKIYLNGSLLSVIYSYGVLLVHKPVGDKFFSMYTKATIPHLAILDCETLTIYGLVGPSIELINSEPLTEQKELTPIQETYDIIISQTRELYKKHGMRRDIVIHLTQIEEDKFSYSLFIDRGFDY